MEAAPATAWAGLAAPRKRGRETTRYFSFDALPEARALRYHPFRRPLEVSQIRSSVIPFHRAEEAWSAQGSFSSVAMLKRHRERK
jgi:hypothetical protein